MKSKNKVREPAAENETAVAHTKSSGVVETQVTVGRGRSQSEPSPVLFTCCRALSKHAPSPIRVPWRSLAVQTAPLEILDFRSEMAAPPLLPTFSYQNLLFPTKPTLFFSGGFSGSSKAPKVSQF